MGCVGYIFEVGMSQNRNAAPLIRRTRVGVQALALCGQALRLSLLRLFLQLAPSKRQRVFVLTLLIGVLCGLAAVAFHLAIQSAEALLIDWALVAIAPAWIFLTILLPTFGGLIGGALLYYVVPDARGSGIPHVKVTYAIKGGRMPFCVAVGKFLIGVVQIGSGASLGREGPTV
jgi:chloride channel protein, CIC family